MLTALVFWSVFAAAPTPMPTPEPRSFQRMCEQCAERACPQKFREACGGKVQAPSAPKR